eukprot:15400272-Alexandrium_andersonii.AAC.1
MVPWLCYQTCCRVAPFASRRSAEGSPKKGEASSSLASVFAERMSLGNAPPCKAYADLQVLDAFRFKQQELLSTNSVRDIAGLQE